MRQRVQAIRVVSRLVSLSSRLRQDCRGVSFVEFALILPIIITLGFYGTEVARMATVSMQVGQIASSLADNASRLGQTDNSAVTPTVTKAQIDSVMMGAMVEGASFGLADHGRIILSSLEKDESTGRQFIHWQRCRGELRAYSRYGTSGAGRTGSVLNGMGNPAIAAPSSQDAVMFVEVSYVYQPLFGTMFVGNPTFRREAAFIIRDDRNLEPGITPNTMDTSCQ